MAIIMFGQQQKGQQKGQQDSEVSYAEFVEKATGMLSLRGQYLVAQNGIQIKAEEFRSAFLNDEQLTLTPSTRYQTMDEGFVSPMTRARNIGWALGDTGDAFISVNVMIGLCTPGLQLPEYRVTRVNPRPTNGQVGDEMWVIGPWAKRDELKLYVTDGKEVEPLERWIERRLQSVN
jgi:hypothetical protein